MADKNLSPLEETLVVLDKLCVANGLPYAVIGGIAGIVHGSARTTIDVDVIVETELERIPQVFQAFLTSFKPLKEDPLRFFQSYYVLPLVHRVLGTKLDVSAALSEFERNAISRALRGRYGEAEVSLCTAEDLILFKLLANRKRDLLDVQDIVLRSKERLDVAYLEETAKRFTEVERSDILETLRGLLS